MRTDILNKRNADRQTDRQTYLYGQAKGSTYRQLERQVVRRTALCNENHPVMFQGINCVDGYICELQTIECSKEPCYPLPRCVRAPGALYHNSIFPFSFVARYQNL